MTKVQTGLDIAKADAFSALHGKNYGLLANHASIDSSYEHILSLLLRYSSGASSTQVKTPGKLVRLFGPEHGFDGVFQDMEGVPSVDGTSAKIPIVSLYGKGEESLIPKENDLEDLDVLVVDLPDIGSRYYTYAQTLAYCMKVAASTSTKVLVFDRPNPIGGTQVEGAPLTKQCRSFCGLLPVPNRHGLTLGELAVMYNLGFGEDEDRLEAINCDLEIVKAKGWSREMYHDDTSLPWVAPSPNMPTLTTAIVYPGACLFEASEVSEGRGTTTPFEYLGAPFINGEEWAEKLTEDLGDSPGVKLRAISFVPKFQKHANETCFGVQIHVTDREKFQPFRLGLRLLESLFTLYPEEAQWRQQAYEFVDKVPAIDLLYGSSAFRKAIEGKSSLEPIWEEIEEFESWFLEERQAFLLY